MAFRTYAIEGIVGGRPLTDRVQAAPTPDYLVPCPCGEEATWWNALGHDDYNVCDACFNDAVPSDARYAWKRLTEDQETDRKQQHVRRTENQDDRYERGVAKLAPNQETGTPIASDQDKEFEEEEKRPKTLDWGLNVRRP